MPAVAVKRSDDLLVNEFPGFARKLFELLYGANDMLKLFQCKHTSGFIIKQRVPLIDVKRKNRCFTKMHPI